MLSWLESSVKGNDTMLEQRLISLLANQKLEAGWTVVGRKGCGFSCMQETIVILDYSKSGRPLPVDELFLNDQDPSFLFNASFACRHRLLLLPLMKAFIGVQ